MKLKTYFKDILREFKISLTKALSIATMVALAALVVIGLGHTGASMRDTLLARLGEMDAYDLKVSSSFKLDYEDQALIESAPGLKDLVYSHYLDVYTGDDLIRVQSFDRLPGYQIIDGSLPYQANEIALDRVYAEGKYRVGDKISLKSLNDDPLTKDLKNTDFIVSGLVVSPEYLMDDTRGISPLGKKSLDGFALIQTENFKSDDYSAAYLDFGLDLENSETYLGQAKEKKDILEDILRNRPEDRLKKLREEIQAEISDAENEISKAKKELTDAKDDLDRASKDLEQGFKDYEDGKNTFYRSISQGEASLADAKVQLDKARADLDQGKLAYDQGKKELESKTAAAQAEIDKGKARLVDLRVQLDQGQAMYEEGMAKIEEAFAGPREELEKAKNHLDEIRKNLDSQWAQYKALLGALEWQKPQYDWSIVADAYRSPYLEDLIGPPSNLLPSSDEASSLKALLDKAEADFQAGLAEYEKNFEAFKSQYESQTSDLTKAKIELDLGEAEYRAGLDKLSLAEKTLTSEKAAGEKKLSQAYDEILTGEAKYQAGLADYEKGLEDLAANKVKGEKELKDSYKKLIEAEAELNKGKKSFEEESEKAEDKISEGQRQIDDAKKAIIKLPSPKYLVETLEDNVGISAYWTNSQRMDDLSFAFPVFFYLVAMLVTVTTMKRMVDEERSQIGTLKSLGYSNIQISLKYFSYGLIPSLAGGILGSILGVNLVSKLIFDAYSTGFYVGNQVLKPKLDLLALTLALSLALILLTVFFTIKNTLKQVPANLLRPEPPKAGSKVFLERIRPLWTRLSFLYKVTARNLFRYKSRMFMTIMGVGGCTALIFFGFAMRGSIVQYNDIQFQEIMKFDIVSIYDPDADQEDLEAYRALVEKEKSTPVLFLEGEIISGEKDEVSIAVPQDSKAFKDFVGLRTAKGAGLDLTDDGAIITEKIAKLAKVNVGDSIFVYDENDVLSQIEIRAISENYLNHYIYMTKEYYEEIFNKEPEMNASYIISDRLDDLEEDLIGNKAVLSLVNISSIGMSAKGLLDSLDLVIVIIIMISAILAIVVLYNLTNINVSERERELSTIKVLGFYPRELTAYVYRETLVLTLMGIGFGYLAGIGIHSYIIDLVVPDPVLLVSHIPLSTYGLSASITLAISLIVMLIVHEKLKHIDMVEALKGTE